MQLDPGCLAHAAADCLAEALDVGGGGPAPVDQEVAVYLGACAPPIVSPRQPAASTSCQALAPGGFLKVEPPVRSRIGWAASRAAVTRSISASIAVRSPGRPRNRALVKITSSGA